MSREVWPSGPPGTRQVWPAGPPGTAPPGLSPMMPSTDAMTEQLSQQISNQMADTLQAIQANELHLSDQLVSIAKKAGIADDLATFSQPKSRNAIRAEQDALESMKDSLPPMRGGGGATSSSRPSKQKSSASKNSELLAMMAASESSSGGEDDEQPPVPHPSDRPAGDNPLTKAYMAAAATNTLDNASEDDLAAIMAAASAGGLEGMSDSSIQALLAMTSTLPDDDDPDQAGAEEDSSDDSDDLADQVEEMEREMMEAMENATARKKKRRKHSDGPQEPTGMDILQAMAEQQHVDQEQEAADLVKITMKPKPQQPRGGYAAVATMHRSAGKARQSQLAAELLLSGKAPEKEDEDPEAPPDHGLVFLGDIPKSTGEGLMRAECNKYGTIASIFLNVDTDDLIEGAWALIKFTTDEAAVDAIKRISRKGKLFGSATPTQVRRGTMNDHARAEHIRGLREQPEEEEAPERFIPSSEEIREMVRAAGVTAEAPPEKPRKLMETRETGFDRATRVEDPTSTGSSKKRTFKEGDKTSKLDFMDRVFERPGQEEARREERKRLRALRKEEEEKTQSTVSSSNISVQHKHSLPSNTSITHDHPTSLREIMANDLRHKAERENRDRDRDRRRGDDRSRRRRREEASEEPADDDSKQKQRGLGGFGNTQSAASATKAVSARPVEDPDGGTQVSVRGSWAEFALPDQRSYWVNIVTGEKSWTRPLGYDAATRTGAAISRESQNIQTALVMNHSNVFVGGLPFGMNEFSFRKLFERFGRIISIKYMSDAFYGFVKFADVHSAHAAIQAMNGVQLEGRPIALQVKFANMDRNH